MATTKVKVLYTFESQPNTGEMTIKEGEILTVSRQDVGEGWWEGTNGNGQSGLFPAAYVEEYTESAPPPMPPPPLPVSYANTQEFVKDEWTDDWGFGSKPTTVASQAKSVTSNQNLMHDDDWDDDWDDDDSEPGTAHSNGTSSGYGFPQNTKVTNSIKHTSSIGDISIGEKDNKGSVLKGFSRFSVLTKSGVDDYMNGLGKFNVDDRDKIHIDDDDTAPFWRHSGIAFTCSITSPKKESKFHGMKSYIAYTITPSTTHQPVSRRYKHFDWLHDRLTVKFSMVPIPPLPEKQVAGRFEEDFIEYRMTMLQSWMDRICQHPVLCHCDVLKHFVTSPNDEKTWKAGKRRAESDKLVGVHLYQAIVRPDAPLDLTITENKLESYTRFFSHLDDAIKFIQRVCIDQSAQHHCAFKREYNKVSHAFSKLSRAFDMDPSNIAPHLTDGIRQISDAYQDIGTIFDEQPKYDWDPLVNLLFEYKGVIDAFPSIINAAKSSISKRKQIQKDSSEGKADHEQVPPIIYRSDTVVYALHAEVTNFHNLRQKDFKVGMTSFLTGQIDFYQKIADRLRDTLQHFNDI